MSDHTPNNDNSTNNLDPESEDKEDIGYGFRCSRCNINYHHKNSLALFCAQRMEQAVYYDTAKIFARISLNYAQIISTLLTLYNRHVASLTTAASNIIESVLLKAK